MSACKSKAQTPSHTLHHAGPGTTLKATPGAKPLVSFQQLMSSLHSTTEYAWVYLGQTQLCSFLPEDPTKMAAPGTCPRFRYPLSLAQGTQVHGRPQGWGLRSCGSYILGKAHHIGSLERGSQLSSSLWLRWAPHSESNLACPQPLPSLHPPAPPTPRSKSSLN